MNLQGGPPERKAGRGRKEGKETGGKEGLKRTGLRRKCPMIQAVVFGARAAKRPPEKADFHLDSHQNL